MIIALAIALLSAYIFPLLFPSSAPASKDAEEVGRDTINMLAAGADVLGNESTKKDKLDIVSIGGESEAVKAPLIP